MRDGEDLTLISTGGLLNTALRTADLLTVYGIEARVLSMHTLKPLDAEAVLAAAMQTGAIATLEEHSIMGGLGSAVAEILAESDQQVPFKRIGLPSAPSAFVGSQEYLRAQYGLTEAEILNSLVTLLHSGRTPQRRRLRVYSTG
jgi:transketolase